MIFCDNLLKPEGPVQLHNGDWLVVEMAPERGCVTRISSDGMERTELAKTGRPNGLAMDDLGCGVEEPSVATEDVDRWSLRDRDDGTG